MTQAVKRACDACHRRKVKCDGINPCRNCSTAQLSCTYNAIPQKKGPKGSRAKVISELRENQRQTSLSAKVQNRMNGVACPPTSPSLTPTPGMLTSDLVKECSQFFFDNLYPQLPILDQQTVNQQILYMEQNRDAYCLMASLCAYIMLQPGMTMPPGDPYNLDMVPGATIVSSQLLLEEALRVRKGYEYLDSITLNALATNFFIFGCYYAQEMHDKAWYYLREATTMIHMIGMDKEEHYHQFDSSEGARRRRLYWLIFATERAYALQHNRPMTLQASINLPTQSDDPTDPLAHQLGAFITQANIFRPFDNNFVAAWSKTRGQMSPQYVNSLQKQLNDVVQSYICQDSNFQDMSTNQQWLKNTVWQLTNATNNTTDDSMSFQYTVDMARELLMNLASAFPGQGMELISSGLIERVLETSCAMTEFLSLQPAPRDPFMTSPREHMQLILTIAAMSRNGDNRFLPLMMDKLNELLPRIVNPMLQNAPENPNLANIDIFDGFGNGGMAQPPQMSMAMDADYDRKFSTDDYDKKYALDMNGSTPESVAHSQTQGGTPPMSQQSTDMNGSFVSSPGGIMSPGMEYPPNMNNFAAMTPMTDMVMSPLGTHGQTNPMNAAPPNQHQHPQHQHHIQPQHQQTQPKVQHPQPQHGIGGMNHQDMRTQSLSGASLSSPHGLNPMGGMRQMPQRGRSYHVQGQPMTVGDFHGLQRGASETGNPMVGMSSMGGEMDFSQLR